MRRDTTFTTGMRLPRAEKTKAKKGKNPSYFSILCEKSYANKIELTTWVKLKFLGCNF